MLHPSRRKRPLEIIGLLPHPGGRSGRRVAHLAGDFDVAQVLKRECGTKDVVQHPLQPRPVASWRMGSLRKAEIPERSRWSEGPGGAAVIQVTPQMRILVAVEPVDGRKGIDTLAQLCREKLSDDPFSGGARASVWSTRLREAAETESESM